MAISVVEVGAKEEKFKKHEGEIKKALEKALSYLQIKDSFIEVALISNEEMRQINKTYTGNDKPTNVLSFEDPKIVSWGEEELNHLGEIYLAPDEIKKREEDIVYLSVHGCLHLLGFNHKKDEEAEEMEKIEMEIMKKC